MSSPLVRSSRSTLTSRAAVAPTRAWLAGSSPGTLSRAGVVRYGPWIRKPRKVSFCVGKNTTSGEPSRGTSRGTPCAVSARNASSTRWPACPRSSSGRSQTNQSSARAARWPWPRAAAAGERDVPARQGRRTPGCSGCVRRSMTVSVIWTPWARSRLMFRRNSRVAGSIRFRAAEISPTAVAAGTVSWSNGKTNRVSGESGTGSRPVLQRLRRGRPDVVVDPEVLGAAVHARGRGVRVHRLEADAELADLREVRGLPALGHPADAPHVGLGERPAVVPDLQPVAEQLERQRGRARVLGVLDQLEDEVGALAVQVPEKIQHGGIPAVPGDVLVADLCVVRWHPGPPSARPPHVSGAGPHAATAKERRRPGASAVDARPPPGATSG